MKPLQIDAHQQKLLIRKIFVLFEKDPQLEFFKLRIEKKDGVFRLAASGQRSGKDLGALEEGTDFHTVVQSLRQQLLEQLPKRSDDERWLEDAGANDSASANL